MSEPKKPRGRPKVPWDPFDEELWTRLSNGTAAATVEAEAAYLARWATDTKVYKPDEPHLKVERIRERIKKRYNGIEGYKQVRLFKLAEFEASNSSI